MARRADSYEGWILVQVLLLSCVTCINQCFSLGLSSSNNNNNYDRSYDNSSYLLYTCHQSSVTVSHYYD